MTISQRAVSTILIVTLLLGGCARRTPIDFDDDIPPTRSSRPPLPSVTNLLAVLDDSDPEIRLAAVVSLAMHGSEAKTAVAGLIARLRDDDLLVRQAAVDALGQLQAADAVGPLTELLTDPSIDIRRSVAVALGKIGPSASTASEALGKALTDLDEDVRMAAAVALGQIGPAARPALAALRHAAATQGDPETKRRIFESLKRIEESDPN